MTEAAIRQQEIKKCPACAELILADAMKCKHCGERLAAPTAPPERLVNSGRPKSKLGSATWIMLAIAVMFAGAGAVIPFSEPAAEARKVSRRIGALDFYVGQIGNDDKVVMNGKVVPRQEAEAKIANLRRDAQRGFTELDRQLADIELSETSVATKDALLKLRDDSIAARNKWWMLLTASAGSILIGFGIATWTVVRHRRMSTTRPNSR